MDILQTVWKWIVESINALFSFLGDGLGHVFFWLPDSPFAPFISSISSSTGISWLNWFIDVSLFVTVFNLLIAALLCWVGYMLVCHLVEWVRTIKQTINPMG